MTTTPNKSDALRIWIPAIQARSGADVFTLRLAETLRRAGHSAIVQWFDPRYEFMPELMRLSRRPEHFDVIHANSWNASAFLGLGVPVVTTVLHLVHDPAYAPYRSAAQAAYHRWHVRWREERAIRLSAAVTAISAYVGRTVNDVFGRSAVDVIPNWVDTERYSPAPDGQVLPKSRFRLLMVGNHSLRKGADLLPAFAEALGPTFDLRCTGGLRSHRMYTQPVNVSMLGHLSEAELIEEYRQCDAVASLSRYEGFGYTALEGMACGKPFVGFRTSGLTDVVVDGESGSLVPINDVKALADCCVQLAKDPMRTKQMGEAARTRATTVFAQATATDAYVEVYRRVLREAQR